MSANTIKVGGAETFSLVDFPDKISAVIFMQGCPWRCPFCHNAFLQDFQHDSGFVWDKFIKFLEARRNILDGVVFSGGEPLVQDNLLQAIQEVKSLGFKIGLHTGGYRPEHLQKVLPLLDWVGLDIKAPLNAEQYAKATGVAPAAQIENIKKSLKMLIDSGTDFECRTTCDPRILTIEDIKTIGDELSSFGVTKYYLQKYRPIESDKTTSDSDCEKFFSNKDLLQYLKSKFKIFDIRK